MSTEHTLYPVAMWWPWAARGVQQVERLRLLRSHAIDAEARGQVDRADFYWLEVHRLAERLSETREAWKAFAGTSGEFADECGDDPEQLFQKFVREALVDTHYAYFRAWQPIDLERAFVHLAHVRRLARLAGLTTDETQAYAGPASLEEVQYRCERREWRAALSLVTDLTRRFPAVPIYHATLADVQCQSTVDALRRTATRRARRHDSRVLSRGLHALKKLRLERPHELATLAAIARLHVNRAETLAADGLLAEALVDAEAAVTYSPTVASGFALRARLEADMQQLRVQTATEVNTSPKRDREAEQRYQQTTKGFRLLDAFRRSDEARAVTDDQLVAQARTAWETIGLPPLAPIDHRPLALNDALQAIMQSPPSEPADLVACWHRVAEDNPHLRDLPATGIAAYLSHQLFGTLFIAAQTDVPLPRLTVGPLAVGAPRASSPPFLFWAFSSRNALLKLQLVAALVLVVVVSILGAREFQGRRVRNAAYSSLQSARKAASLEPMLDAAEQFLSVRPFAVDARVAEVEALYSEALVRWFSETGPAPEVANSRIRRYGELLAITGSQER